MSDDLVKRPNQKLSYTRDQMIEFARCADPVTGYSYFMRNYFYIQHPTKGQLKYAPFEYQERLIQTYHENRFSIALMPRQTGKALPLDTKIPTPDGWTTMGDISVGDEVIGKDGKPTRVVMATDIMYNHTCYEIEFDNDHTVVADAEHLWEINTSDWRTGSKVKTTKEIKSLIETKRDDKNYYIEINDAINCVEAELPIDPYVLGFWLGDGYSAGARFVQHKDDIKNALSIMESKGYNVSGLRESGNSFRANVVGLYKKLRLNGLLNNKHIPNKYLRASTKQRLELLQGLMDTDGSVSKKSGSCEFYQKDIKMIKQVGELLSSLGIKYRVSEKEIKNQIYHTIRFCTELEVFKYQRKLKYQKQSKNHPKSTRFYITKIREVDSTPVRCIQVDNEDHMFLCSEQMIPTHNSTSAAGYLLWFAMFKPDSIILIAAHKQSGASEIMQRVRYAYELCPDFIRCGATTYNKNSIEFDNGSRLVAQATTENTGRGMSITLLYLDEFAFVRNTIAEEFWTAMRPTLATGGKCIITSTPNSDEDQFAQIWSSANKTIDEFGNDTGIGINGFKAFRSYWNEHPDRDEKWAAEEEAAIGTERFRREHGCEFIIHEETLISGLKLVEMEGVDPIKTEGQVRWYKEPTKDHVYLVSLDPAFGTGGDNAAIQIIELPDMIQVGEWMHNKTDMPSQVRILRDIVNHLAEVTESETSVYFSVENNSIGEATLISIAEMGEENFRGIFISEPRRMGNVRKFRKGFNTTENAKIAACAKFKSLIESERMTINSKPLISELKTFVAYGRSYRAKEGERDDLVMSALLAVRMATVIKEYDPSLEKQLRDHSEERLEPLPFIMIT